MVKSYYNHGRSGGGEELQNCYEAVYEKGQSRLLLK